jgi:hypothetical protein
MSTTAVEVADRLRAPAWSSAPRLRLLPKGASARAPAHRSQPRIATAQPATPRPAADDAPVLIAGHDAGRRAKVHRDLSESMPAGTRFEELDSFWEVLARAPSSRMVILSGELDELSPESLLHALGHRHPDLPVVSLGRGGGRD